MKHTLALFLFASALFAQTAEITPYSPRPTAPDAKVCRQFDIEVGHKIVVPCQPHTHGFLWRMFHGRRK